jgi:hypothetical protein
MNVYILGDPSHGHNRTSDRTAICVIGVTRGPKRYLLDGYRHRMQLKERWERLRDLQKRWVNMPGVVSVECAWERYGMQSDMEYFEERMRHERIYFPIREVNWTGERGGESKKARVGRLEPYFREGSFLVPWKVWHPRVAPKRDRDGNIVPLADGTPDLGPGVARWFVQDEDDDIHLEPIKGPHARERECLAAGERFRVMDDGIRRIDEDGNVYDLTRMFFEEYRRFPLAAHDDLIDAMSRICDMDTMEPMPIEAMHREVESYQDD